MCKKTINVENAHKKFVRTNSQQIIVPKVTQIKQKININVLDITSDKQKCNWVILKSN